MPSIRPRCRRRAAQPCIGKVPVVRRHDEAQDDPEHPPKLVYFDEKARKAIQHNAQHATGGTQAEHVNFVVQHVVVQVFDRNAEHTDMHGQEQEQAHSALLGPNDHVGVVNYREYLPKILKYPGERPWAIFGQMEVKGVQANPQKRVVLHHFPGNFDHFNPEVEGPWVAAHQAQEDRARCCGEDDYGHTEHGKLQTQITAAHFPQAKQGQHEHTGRQGKRGPGRTRKRQYKARHTAHRQHRRQRPHAKPVAGELDANQNGQHQGQIRPKQVGMACQTGHPKHVAEFSVNTEVGPHGGIVRYLSQSAQAQRAFQCILHQGHQHIDRNIGTQAHQHDVKMPLAHALVDDHHEEDPQLEHLDHFKKRHFPERPEDDGKNAKRHHGQPPPGNGRHPKLEPVPTVEIPEQENNQGQQEKIGQMDAQRKRAAHVGLAEQVERGLDRRRKGQPKQEKQPGVLAGVYQQREGRGQHQRHGINRAGRENDNGHCSTVHRGGPNQEDGPDPASQQSRDHPAGPLKLR